jgi:hypothetical protein
MKTKFLGKTINTETYENGNGPRGFELHLITKFKDRSQAKKFENSLMQLIAKNA